MMPQQVPSPYVYRKYSGVNNEQPSEHDAYFNEDIDLDNLLSYRQFESMIEDPDVLNNTTASLKQTAKFEHANIVHEILYDSELCRAGVLFTLDNDLLLSDFPLTIEILKKIIDSKSYINNLNQQSIVEIVLTKCITALK
jgi:hypothetical protein